jgi:hypothetical protein
MVIAPCYFVAQGFYWIPSLAGPTSIETRGTEWLFPFVDGQPPIGWDNAAPYLVLPVLLVLCQYVSSSIISPPIDPNAENANTQRALYTFLPMMIGWFALNVPSGLGLYYLANTVMTTLIQVRSGHVLFLLPLQFFPYRTPRTIVSRRAVTSSVTGNGCAVASLTGEASASQFHR